MINQLIEKLKENAPYVTIGVVAGFMLRNILEDIMDSDMLSEYTDSSEPIDCNS